MEELRQKKKELKKLRKELHRKGLKNKEWFITMREHNRVKEREAVIRNCQQQKQFKKNPMRFGRELFQKKVSGDPTFSSQVALDYFSKIYHDEKRETPFTPLPEMKRPPPPVHLLSEEPPSQAEIMTVLRLKRNGAAPGPNGISYVPYKKCPAVWPFMHKIFSKVWETRDVPSSWAFASILLLPKSDKTSDPAEFRPIALTNTMGKIFFSVNKFTSHAQKGFKTNTPGCLEHSFAMFEALRDAKQNQRQVVVTWLDLCNAYGSVKHNLVQFALQWYHVPASFSNLIVEYYDKICACIRTKNWSSAAFLFDLGLFQGCVLSCVLFSCVFQLLLDMLAPLAEQNGYHFKDSPIVLHDQAFADDLSILSSCPQLSQITIDAVH